MRIAIDSFRGESPRLTPRALPENAAQLATNARLLTGDLEAWRQFAVTKALATAAPVRTIYLLNGQWLSWGVDVDVARGPVAGDTTFRTYMTAPGFYAEPRFTTFAMATTGAEPYPVATRPLGVPSPDEPPTVAFDVSAETESSVALTNPGAESGSTTGWTVDSGSLVVFETGDIVGLDAHSGTHFFAGGSVAASEAHQDVDLDAEGIVDNQGLRLSWQQATGANGSTAAMGLEFYDEFDVLISASAVDQVAPAAVNSWERREMTAQVPPGATTARIVQYYTRVGAGPQIDAYIDTIALVGVEFTNYFDGSTLTGWTASSNEGTPGGGDAWRQVAVDAGVGWAPPAILLRGDEAVPWIHRDFSTNSSPAVTLKFDFLQSMEPGWGLLVNLFATETGGGSALFLGPGGIFVSTCASWDDRGASTATIAGALPIDVVYTVTISAEQLSTGKARITLRIVNSAGTVIVDNAQTTIAVDGAYIGFKAATGSLEGRWWVDNVYVTVAPPDSRDSVTSTATAYVYTFVNDLGEESAPSPVSETALRPSGVDVTVTTPAAAPSGISGAYGIATKRLYRAATGASGSIFLFVAEIPVSQTEYIDSLTDAQLGEALASEGWDLPPDDLEGILALPNGIMVGFSGNQLCLSAQNRPHAWPVAYRLTADSDIVAIANVDTTVVIGTRTFVYTASGTSPDSYTMSKPGVPQACVAKRSMATLYGGVVFASPDGLMLVAGPTQVRNLTSGIFTRRQWQALHPESIVAAVHDDTYHFFFDPTYTPDGAPAGYAIDAKEDGFGVIRLGFHATALHADPLTDSLHLVLSDVDEPATPYLLEASTAPNPNGATIYEFDANEAAAMVFQWRGKLNLMPYPACFQVCQVQAEDYDNLVLRLYGDGDMLIERRVVSAAEFTLPMLDTYREFEVELIGTSRVRRVQVAEDVMELS